MAEPGKMAVKRYQKLVDIFIESGELGHYDTRNFSICLYNMPNNSTDIRLLRRRIKEVTEKFKLVVLDPCEMRSNINILDIEL